MDSVPPAKKDEDFIELEYQIVKDLHWLTLNDTERTESLIARRQKLESMRKSSPYDKAWGEANTSSHMLVGAFISGFPAARSEGNEKKLLTPTID